MRLLIITQKVDSEDAILGFFHRWIEEFARHFDKVNVICLEKRVFDLPNNVAVHSLGKELGKSNIRALYRFYKYIWNLRSEYDSVFVHMNPIYVILGGLLWRAWKKQIALWYTHKQVDLKLRIAEKLANKIFTAAPESFTLRSNKVLLVGHGIDVGNFAFYPHNQKSRTLVHVGRITPIKHCEVLIETLEILNKQEDWNVVFIGEPITDSDQNYYKRIRELTTGKKLDGNVQFLGSLKAEKINNIYSISFASVNSTPAGGLDKVVLESWVSGCPAFTSNTAFDDFYGKYADVFIFGFSNSIDLSEKIMKFREMRNNLQTVEELSKTAREQYDITAIVSKITKILND